ncbi:Uncharacterised protein [Mycobacteroides abscessus subsp. abscessus]|nr:Uncharacterised protein [Mycobacteroides abscessus subsp. abscessus]
MGHQNHRPMRAAIAGVMNARMMKVSKSRPRQMADPDCPIAMRSLVIIEPMVNANTRPAWVATLPDPPTPRRIAVFRPPCSSSLNLDTRSRL